jgi:hypothetical protein
MIISPLHQGRMGADPGLAGVFTSGLQAALALPAGGQVERDRGAGTASARQNPHPVGYLSNEPQAVAGPARQRVP